MNTLSNSAIKRPSSWFWASGIISAMLIALVLISTFMPNVLPLLSPLKIDTDPENMLRQDEPVRQHHNQMKETFDLADIIVVGVTNNQHEIWRMEPQLLKQYS